MLYLVEPNTYVLNSIGNACKVWYSTISFYNCMEFDCFNKNSIVWHFKIFDILKHLIQTVIRGLSKAELERGDSCVLRFQCRICLRFLGLPVVIFLIHRNAAAGFFICRSSGGPFCGKYVLLSKGKIQIIGFVSVFWWICRVCLQMSLILPFEVIKLYPFNHFSRIESSNLSFYQQKWSEEMVQWHEEIQLMFVV